MHNDPEKKEKYFKDLNEEIEAENKVYEKRIKTLLKEVEDEKNKKIKFMKVNDKLNKFKNKIKEGIEIEANKKKVHKIQTEVHENLQKFIQNKIKKNNEIKKFKQKNKDDFNKSRLEINQEK